MNTCIEYGKCKKNKKIKKTYFSDLRWNLNFIFWNKITIKQISCWDEIKQIVNVLKLIKKFLYKQKIKNNL